MLKQEWRIRTPHREAAAKHSECLCLRLSGRVWNYTFSCRDYHIITPKFEDLWLSVTGQGANAEAVMDGVNETINSMTGKPLCNKKCHGIERKKALEQRYINCIFIYLLKEWL